MATTKNQTGMDEQSLARVASTRLDLENQAGSDPGVPLPGQTLPAEFVNPPIGTRGHRCLDQRGRYQPEWYSLKIHKVSENMPQRQYFNANGKGWFVEVGTFVDVPPQIINVLSYTDQQVIRMDMTQTALMTERGVTQVVDVVPRFSYTSIASA